MENITTYPYFSYSQILNSLLEPISSQADVQFLSFRRRYSDYTRFLICNNQDWAHNYYSRQFYLYGLFERNDQLVEPGFYMWDHLKCDPHGIYEHSRQKLNIAHGLTIFKRCQGYSDVFIFTSKPVNPTVNNFYLNKKDLFTNYINDFYQAFDSSFDFLSKNTFYIAPNNDFNLDLNPLSPRQQDCALLMAKGLTSKEIARQLNLSPRTIEEHIAKLKGKFNAKNRVQLSAMLQRYL
jgi:DNA-binding CsgD family transcriptional regulator